MPRVRQWILHSLVNHWDGLTVFVEHPEVPMDNSEAERQLRGPAMGRKNFWASGAQWAGELAECCFSLFATLLLTDLNVRTWLTAYFTACAEAAGKAPEWAAQCLPWNLSPSQREAFQQPLSGNTLPNVVRECLDQLATNSGKPPTAEPSVNSPEPESAEAPVGEAPVGEAPVGAALLSSPPPELGPPRIPSANSPQPVGCPSKNSDTNSTHSLFSNLKFQISNWVDRWTGKPQPPPVAEPPPDPFPQGTPRRRPPGFPLIYSGRLFSLAELQQIRELIAAAPHASRTEISRRVCQLLDWRKPDGGWKEVSCRVALLRMRDDGWLTLPAPRCTHLNQRRAPARTPAAEPQPPLECSLPQLGPLRLEIVTRERSVLWNEYIDRYHYLGHTTLVGAKMRYWVYAENRLVALLGYGASAWRLAPRDRWIGWTDAQRRAGLSRVVNQARFLILPWIRCRHLASRILSLSSARLAVDWERRYAIRPWLLETFVDASRYLGTCYRAANWLDVGETQGRRKKGRHFRSPLPRKRIYLYPLCHNCPIRFRKL